MQTITFEYVDDEGEEHTGELPARWEVCPRCNGEGKHVNPSIDGNGIISDEWENEWDEDERDAYMSGRYDVTCEECNGRTTIAVVDREQADPAMLARHDAIERANAEIEAIYRAERAMGA